MWKIIKSVLLLVPVILLISVMLIKEIRADAAVTGTVKASALFVREGPGSGYNIKKLNDKQIRLMQGDYVAVSWEEDGWYYITAGFEGTTINGYVAKDFISVSGAIPTGKPAITPTPIIKAGTANIPQGTTLAVMTSGFPYDGWVAATTLNVRDGAGTSYTVIDSLKDGAKVTVTGVKKSTVGAYWYTISYTKNGKTCTGTASASYIAVQVHASTASQGTSSATVSLKTSGFPIEGKVVADALNVREAAGTAATRKTIIASGEKVTVLAAEKIADGTWWYKISYRKNGADNIGYVLSDFISTDNGNTGTPSDTTPDGGSGNASYNNIIMYYEIPVSERGSLYYGGSVNADRLNVRDKASVSGKSIAKIVQNTRVIVLDRVSTESGYWYKIAAKASGKIITGYSSAEYIVLDYDGEVYGTVKKTGTMLRERPSGSSGLAVSEFGTVVGFSEGDKVLLVEESTSGGEKWFKVRVGDGTTGYVICTEVDLIGGNIIRTSPTPTPGPFNTPSPTPKSQADPTKRPTSTPIPSAFPTPYTYNAKDGYPSNFVEKHQTGYGALINRLELTVNTKPWLNDELLLDKFGDPITIDSSVSLSLYDIYNDRDGAFRHVRFVYDDEVMMGYLKDSDIYTFTADEARVKVTPTPIPQNMKDLSPDVFIEMMEEAGFPSDYIGPLLELHGLHPNWIFEAYVTGIDWNTLVEQESKPGINLIPSTSASGMLSTEPGAYDPLNDKYIVYDGPSWVTASKEANEYYLDPRNFLESSSVFMFETLTYKDRYQSADQVEELLKNTPFYNKTFTYTDDNGRSRTITYAQAFIEAAEYSGISPYHLATRVRQEVVTGTNTCSNSVSGTVTGYTGYYNFYNIGAYHSTAAGGAIINGLKYAKNGLANNDAYNDASLIPWNNPYRAIVGGAYIIGQQYISRGQDTIYLQKFNVTENNTFSHQYMANIEAPKAEATKMAKGYSDPDATVFFRIPVYENMPEENADKPETTGNRNNYLSKLEVYDMNGVKLTLSPEFDTINETDYYITTTEGNSILQIVAEPVSGKATIGGNGIVVVSSNSDVFKIKVTAENGDVRTYNLHASKK